MTVDVSGGNSYFGEPAVMAPNTIACWFDISETPWDMHTVILALWAHDITGTEKWTVYFYEPDGTAHHLGLLPVTDCGGTKVGYYFLDPDWLGVGRNLVEIYSEGCSIAGVLDAKLFIGYGGMRAGEMVCKAVWINEENNFEFIFDRYYASNNWVKIYDMDGNLVWEVDFTHGDNQFEVDLPDGMYTVMTFHDSDMPIQTFVIGKP
jgi:uncharacterized protein YkuJ